MFLTMMMMTDEASESRRLDGISKSDVEPDDDVRLMMMLDLMMSLVISHEDNEDKSF